MEELRTMEKVPARHGGEFFALTDDAHLQIHDAKIIKNE
jgi:hypothetical protein